MRIFFCGAQGVGKSTLTKILAADLGIKEYDSMSALFMKSKEEQFQKQFQEKLKVYCLNIFLNEESDLVMSRSIIDSLAYNKSRVLIKNLLPLSIKENDYYFYIPIEFPITSSGNSLRDTSISYQRDIDKKIQYFFKKHPSKNKFIIRGSIEERVVKIKEIVKWKK